MRKARKSQLPILENWLDLEHSKELEAISRLLDDHPRIADLALQDLSQSADGQASRSQAGARGMTAEQVLRAMLVKQMNGFSYRQLAFHLADSRSYRTFCRFGVGDPAPKKSALQANIKALSAETLERVHWAILEAAADRGIHQGRRVRIDCTQVESNIHHPTDSELLWDCVRVLTRLLHRARKVLGPETIEFHDRTRRAKRRRKEINTARRQVNRLAPYKDLIAVTEEVVGYSEVALGALDHQARRTKIQRLRKGFERFLPPARKVIEQAQRRVLAGETVPALEKIVSIFETHTDIVRKDARDTYYGHKVCLTASRSCLILDAKILEGNPPDSTLPVTMIQRLRENLGKPPKQAAFDGGFSSKANLKAVKAEGVEDVVFAKGPGLKPSDMAKSTWVYRSLRNFRAGVEGIISFLKRAFGLDRCTWRSWPSFQSYVWSSLITSNLLILARHFL